jgi:hypothetical protein
MFSSLPTSFQDIFIQCSNHTIRKRHVTTSITQCELMSIQEIMENCSLIIFGMIVFIVLNLVCLLILVVFMPVFKWTYGKLRLNQEESNSSDSLTILNGLDKFSILFKKLNNYFRFTK